MVREFSTSMDIEATLLHALDQITDHLNAEGGALFLLEENGEILRCACCVGATEITGIRLPSTKGIIGRSVQSDQGTIVRDVSKDPDFNTEVDKETGFTTKSILCAPLSVQEEMLGAIELINKRDGDGLFATEDLHLLEALSTSAALAILNARMAAALVEQERLKRELELAAEIQRSLLPTPPDEPFPVHGINLPARTVSGDFYDFFHLDDGRIAFCLGDVSGKGMNAALLMAKTASLFRALGKTEHQPGKLLARINAEICETAARGMFVTMVGGLFDPRSNELCFANAGHEPPLLHHVGGTVFDDFPAEFPPLGISTLVVPEDGYPEVTLSLDGGTFYIFTDGVTEGHIDDGSMLGVDGFKAAIVDCTQENTANRLATIVERVMQEGVPLHDDITVLAIEPVAAKIFSHTISARASELKEMRNGLKAALETLGCDAATSGDIILAVDEACQNIIRHAYGQECDEQICLEVERQDQTLVLRLQDYAEPVNVDTIRPRDLDDLRPGGLGTHFIRELMDDVMNRTGIVGGRLV